MRRVSTKVKGWYKRDSVTSWVTKKKWFIFMHVSKNEPFLNHKRLNGLTQRQTWPSPNISSLNLSFLPSLPTAPLIKGHPSFYCQYRPNHISLRVSLSCTIIIIAQHANNTVTLFDINRRNNHVNIPWLVTSLVRCKTAAESTLYTANKNCLVTKCYWVTTAII